MLHTDVLGRNHLAVEHHVLRAVLLVQLLHDREHALYEVLVLVVGGDLESHELGSLHQTVDTNGQILTTDIDVTGIEQRQHTMSLQLL